MRTQQISRRYARALFELEQDGAKNRAALEKLAAVAELDAVREVLGNPSYPAKLKTAVLEKAAGTLPAEMKRLVAMLCERGKAELLPEIRELFEQMMRQAESEVEADVVTAVKLSEAQQKGLAKELGKITGRSVRLSVSEDASLLGGLVVRIGDRLIDYSVRSRLEALKRAMAA
ncbi:MAG TPA: F0F1 ATP synthase subunit delta [Mariprofundaceae bacterium]|nr:F0F1 ATP synthase subunit delta [Mariprofundaceae bacterium]